METGRVESYGKMRYGFIISEEKGDKVFFHLNDCVPAERRDPEKGERVYFFREQKKRGPKTQKWSFNPDALRK